MLSPAEESLIGRDAELPGLECLLNAEVFRARLQRVSGMPLPHVSLRYLRYKPRQNCLAAFLLKTAEADFECHAKAYRKGDAKKLDKAESRPSAAGLLGGGRLVWPELAVEVCLFPNDNKLGSLRLLADEAWRSDFLQRHLPEHPRLWRSAIHTLAYKPERRWVGALEVDGTPQAVGKLYGEAAFDAARARAKQFTDGDVLKVAPLLGRSKGRHALFFGWQTGAVLSESMRASSWDVAAAQRVGTALRELHRQNPLTLPRRSTETDAQAVLGVSEFLRFVLPSLTTVVERIADRVAAAVHVAPAELTAIHGDFYAKQVLDGGSRIAVLDLDEAAYGDPHVDLASFIAHLEREVVAGRLSQGRCSAVTEHLLAGYRGAGGSVSPERLGFRTAERLFLRATDFFRTHDCDWPERTLELLSRVEALLSSRHDTILAPGPVDPLLPKLDVALSRAKMESHLANLVRQSDPQVRTAALRRVELRRHKQGRRALIQYELELQGSGGADVLTLLGKCRRRGVNAKQLALWRELSEDQFGPNTSDGISVPQVFGVIDELGMTLQRFVVGRSPAAWLARGDLVSFARRAAEAVCKLHQCEVRTPTRLHTAADELAILENRLTALAMVRTSWTHRIETLRQACRAMIAGLPSVSPRLIHRDFYHDQLLWDGHRIWLTDLDLLCLGDPALDAGNFVGHLLEWRVRCPGEGPALGLAATAFIDRFRELSDPRSWEAVESYTTLTLARLVCLSLQFPERAPFTEQILELCEARCRPT